MDTFQVKQRELCLLSSFISEHEQWLGTLLGKLKWSQNNLKSESKNSMLVQCPYNEHHYVIKSSLEDHKTKCLYTSMGVDVKSLEESEPLTVPKDTLYKNSCVSTIEIDPAIERAVAVCARDPEQSVNRKPNEQHSLQTQAVGESLEDSQMTGLDVSKLQPHQVISFIKSWTKVPSDWSSLVLSSLNLVQLKGWLFQNLPREHAYSASVGGEIVAVDTILNSLSLLPGKPVEATTSPNLLVEKLKPVLRSNTAQFVLSMWKFIHTTRVQTQYGISDSIIEDIAPMPSAQLMILRGATITEKEDVPAIVQKIEQLSQEDSVINSSTFSHHTLPVPMDTVFFSRTPAERRVMYDYVVGASQSDMPREGKKTLDPDLYRDDVAALKAKLRAEAQQEESGTAQETKSYHEVLKDRKEKRDYKRRRQKYRAKNVHITRRKTSEIFRDIINNRMEEIKDSMPNTSTQDQEYNLTNTQDKEPRTSETELPLPSKETTINHRKERLSSRDTPGDTPHPPKRSTSPGFDRESRRRDKQSEKSRRKKSYRSRSRSRSREKHKKHKKHSHKHSKRGDRN